MGSATPEKDAPGDPFAERKKEILNRAIESKIITKGEAGRLSKLGLEQMIELLSQAAIDAGLGAAETNDLLFGP